MKYRSACGEHVDEESWVMRDLWNAAKLPKKEEKGKINEPIKLQSIGVKRLVERLSNSYYRATYHEILEDYLKAVPQLTISKELRLQKQMEEAAKHSRNDNINIKSQLFEKENAIAILTESNSSNADAIAALSDQIMKLMSEIEALKNVNAVKTS